MIAIPLVASNIKKELGSFFSTEAHSDFDITRYINSSARLICTEKNFTFNKFVHELTVTEWQTDYTIPYQIETYFIQGEGWADDEVDIWTFEEYYRTSDKTQLIWIWDDKLATKKTWTFNIFYKWFPDAITDLLGSIDMPNHFYDVLVLGAIYYWFMDIKNYSMAWTKLTIFNGLLKSLARRNSDPKPLKTKRLNRGKNKTF